MSSHMKNQTQTVDVFFVRSFNESKITISIVTMCNDDKLTTHLVSTINPTLKELAVELTE